MNTNLQQLLTSLGPPPKEVCVDWTWQIIRSSANAKTGPTSQDSDWSQWSIDELGQLTYVGRKLDANEGEDLPEAAHLIAQLLDWAGAEWTSPDDRLKRSEQVSALEKLKPAIVGETAAKQSIAKQSIAGTKATSPLKSPRPKRLKKRSATGQRSDGRKNRTKVGLSFSKKHLLICGVLLIAIVVLSNRFISVFMEKAATTASEAQAQAAEIASEESTGRGSPGLNDRSLVVKPDDRNEPAFAASSEKVDSLERLLETSHELELLPDESQLSADENLTLGLISESLELGARLSTTFGPDSPTSELDQAFVNDSVSASLQSIGEPDGLVSEIDGQVMETEAESFVFVSAQHLKLGSAEQVMAFPKSPPMRLVQWVLSLETSEQLTVEPEQAQELTGRNTLTWRVTPKITERSNSLETLRIIVQAKLSGRSADLRWTLAAVRDDLPFTMALDQKQLDQIQAVLLQHQDRLRVAVEAVKARSRQAGLSRELRGALSAERRFLEDQADWVERALELSSDAVLVIAQLGHGPRVRGVLREQSSAQVGQVILRMGEIDVAE